MKVEGNKPGQGNEVRRFTAGRAAPQPGGKSFAATLREAAAAPIPAPTPAPAQPAASAPSAEPAEPASRSAEASGETPLSFADHMEMVRYRLKTGYYDSKAIQDALSEKLSGFFEELE